MDICANYPAWKLKIMGLIINAKPEKLEKINEQALKYAEEAHS